MTNICVSWEFIKNKVDNEAKTLYYYLNDWNWQIYVLDGPDAYIHYIPRPDKFDKMVIDQENKTKFQLEYNDFESNYKANAVETEGLSQ
ncbi:MAG: hypothetical protein ACTSX6_00260 [Candidatus Heimdallarchaeaceae archaeon]